MRVAHSGRASVSVRRPRAISECDRCGFWWNLDRLKQQMQWGGNNLIDTGLLVCPECYDKPFDQYRSPILPPDPFPRINPRPSPNVTGIPYVGGPLPTTYGNQNFTTFNLGAAGIPGLYPSTQTDVLNAVQAASGIPLPPLSNIASYIVPLNSQPVLLVPTHIPMPAVPLVPPNQQRNFLLIYNPTQFGAQFSLGIATTGALSNLFIGPGEAFYWATAQGLGQVYQGGLTALGAFPSLPLWAWEDQSNVTLTPAGLANDMGVLYLTPQAPNYPTSTTGVPPGGVWSNGLAVSITPGGVPNPAKPAMFFGSITAANLLSVGAAAIPQSDPNVPNQLWNNGGLCCVSIGGL